MHIISRTTLLAVCVCLGALLLGIGGHNFDPDARSAVSRPRLALQEGARVQQAARAGAAALLGRGANAVLAENRRTGLWGGHTPPNWWQSALAVDALLRYGQERGGNQPWLQSMLLRIYRRNVFRPHSRARRDFANEFMDDTAWWGQAWAEAAGYEIARRHDLLAAERFLAVAEHDAHYIARHPRPCGGIEWELGTGTDTVTNAEFATLAADLAILRGMPGPLHDSAAATRWRAAALRTLDWLERSGLVDVRAGTLHDRFGSGCRSYVGGPMTYTEGEMADALVRIGQATGERRYVAQASRFLLYTLGPSSGLITGGVLHERCEATRAQCANLDNRSDMPAYKGVFINAVVDWQSASRSHRFDSFLQQQARAILAHSVRGPDGIPGDCSSATMCRFVFAWTRPRAVPPKLRRHALNVSVASQVSALDALTAALGQRSIGPPLAL